MLQRYFGFIDKVSANKLNSRMYSVHFCFFLYVNSFLKSFFKFSTFVSSFFFKEKDHLNKNAESVSFAFSRE